MRTLILIPLFTTACLIPVTNEDHVTDAAARLCFEERACGDVGDDATWPDLTACRADYEDLFRSVWPDEDCNAETFASTAYRTCLEDAREAACEEGFVDTIDAIDACRPARVCDG